MKGKLTFLLLLFCAQSLVIKAQDSDFATWTSIGTEKKLGKFSIGAEAEYRLNDNSSTFNRIDLQFETAYKIAKPVKIGFGYKYMYFNDIEYSDYQPRQRYFAYLQTQKKFNDFKLSVKLKFQRTVKDESDRIKASGEYDTYKINPAWVFRPRIKLSYNIPQIKLTPSFSYEAFLRLNESNEEKFYESRYKLAFEYKFNKAHCLELYNMLNTEIDDALKINTYILGLKYKFEF